MRRSSSINSLKGGCWVTQAIMPRGGRWASQEVMSRTVMPREAFLFHASQLRLGLVVPTQGWQPFLGIGIGIGTDLCQLHFGLLNSFRDSVPVGIV